ncbi:hypothetical protein Syun_004863 [Stephania yunnanensis]|uniref:Uncharacterized protein n=1 Tax=Stephania yunnanensis TaxID=152371 RepID=A0AAP0Q5D1_9MAGN
MNDDEKRENRKRSEVLGLSGAKPALKERVLLKIVIIGNTGYIDRKFNQNYRASLGADFLTKHVLINGKRVILQIWDTAGQEKYNSLGVAFYRGVDACILVYDVNARNTFAAINKWLANVKCPETFPYLLVGNKVDVDNGAHRQVSVKQAKDWCRSKGNVPYYETSAKDGLNVDNAFLHIAKIALAPHDKDIYIYGHKRNKKKKKQFPAPQFAHAEMVSTGRVQKL